MNVKREIMDEKTSEIVVSAIKEVAKDAYQDGGKPIVKPAGELIGLIPRAIKAKLLPLEKWILVQEYNLKETEMLLAQKLVGTKPDLIETPEPHIAVPALQYISYCMDNEELRNMYANLLANSMNKVVKKGVHPSFVEIIKQLCPDEAKILKILNVKDTCPIISLRHERGNGLGFYLIKTFSNIGEIAGCEKPLDIQEYIVNLDRLGIIEIDRDSLLEQSHYEPLLNHPYIQSRMTISDENKQRGYSNVITDSGTIVLTALGKAFCSICLDKQSLRAGLCQ
jgi:hypothetical protein